MPKFFVPNNQVKGEIIKIIGNDVNHISNVLRLKKDDFIDICDKDSSITYETKIANISKDEIVCKIIRNLYEETESKILVTVFQGLPKFDKMEYIIQKSTELGAIEIVPTSMKRCVVKLDEKSKLKKQERWQKIAEASSKQCGRCTIPNVSNFVDINCLKDKIKDFDLFLVAYENEKTNTLKNELVVFHSLLQTKAFEQGQEVGKEKINSNLTSKIAIVIGPEGGLEESEVNMLKQNGAKIVSLGKRILRTETVAISVLSNIMYEFLV